MRYLTLTVTFLLFMVSLVHLAHAADLQINVTDLRNQQGQVAIAVYDDATAYQENNAEKAAYTFLLKSSDAVKLTLHDVPVGQYVIVVLHDENKNQILDMDKRNFPTEGYAYSNNVGEYEVPTFEEASFKLQEGEDTTQALKLRYIK